jgi:hypothetical protein
LAFMIQSLMWGSICKEKTQIWKKKRKEAKRKLGVPFVFFSLPPLSFPSLLSLTFLAEPLFLFVPSLCYSFELNKKTNKRFWGHTGNKN